jgi:hypothetical protein
VQLPPSWLCALTGTGSARRESTGHPRVRPPGRWDPACRVPNASGGCGRRRQRLSDEAGPRLTTVRRSKVEPEDPAWVRWVVGAFMLFAGGAMGGIAVSLLPDASRQSAVRVPRSGRTTRNDITGPSDSGGERRSGTGSRRARIATHRRAHRDPHEGHAMTEPPGTRTAPAWHPDPHDQTGLRHWDGAQWTDRTARPAPQAETAQAPAPQAQPAPPPLPTWAAPPAPAPGSLAPGASPTSTSHPGHPAAQGWGSPPGTTQTPATAPATAPAPAATPFLAGQARRSPAAPPGVMVAAGGRPPGADAQDGRGRAGWRDGRCASS